MNDQYSSNLPSSAPSELRLLALDLLLYKLAVEAPPKMLGQIKAVSGSTSVSDIFH